MNKIWNKIMGGSVSGNPSDIKKSKRTYYIMVAVAESGECLGQKNCVTSTNIAEQKQMFAEYPTACTLLIMPPRGKSKVVHKNK